MVEQSDQLNQILAELGDVMQQRRQASPDSSYVAQLLHQGEDKILKKVIEEAGEVLMASKDGDKAHLVKEVADVWFHTLVLLTYHGLRPEDVLNELQRRQHTSGLVEKANRQPHD
ncbi:phosphoribosyl-ATP diphosphatase [Neisseriaceae bacterium ESL0693]|nr:phosphoribosyl-ATP diphosphatase [Neisseriaceae bacterium ESL0693]